jgi:hypothetical protein
MSTSISNEWVTWPRAATVRVDSNGLHVKLKDGREISVPLDWFDFLAGATEVQRQDFAIGDDGAAISWDQLDDSISVPSLLGLPEHPPPDPNVRSYVIDYRGEVDTWTAEIRGTGFSTFGRTLASAKRRARELLCAYLQVKDLDAAGIDVVDEVDARAGVKA